MLPMSTKGWLATEGIWQTNEEKYMVWKAGEFPKVVVWSGYMVSCLVCHVSILMVRPAVCCLMCDVCCLPCLVLCDVQSVFVYTYTHTPRHRHRMPSGVLCRAPLFYFHFDPCFMHLLSSTPSNVSYPMVPCTPTTD